MPQYSEQEKNNIASANSLFDGSCGDPASLFADDAIWWNGLPRLPGLEGKTEHKGIETIKKILYGAGQDQPNSGTDSYDLSTNRFTDLLVIADNDYVMRQHTQHTASKPASIAKTARHRRRSCACADLGTTRAIAALRGKGSRPASKEPCIAMS